MPEADRRLRLVAQLRKLWRAFRDPQERLEDESILRSIAENSSSCIRSHEAIATYGRPAIRAVIRHWWCIGNYAAILELAEHLDPALFDEEPLIRVYLDEARANLAARMMSIS